MKRFGGSKAVYISSVNGFGGTSIVLGVVMLTSGAVSLLSLIIILLLHTCRIEERKISNFDPNSANW